MSPLGIPNLAGPSLPQSPGHAIGQPGNPYGYPTSPTGAQSAPPNTLGNLATGIAAFLTNYHQGREAEKASSKQDFLSDVQLMMLGIPVSHVEMAKKAKKAGMDLDFENDNSPAVAAQGANAGVAQQQSQAIQQGPGQALGQMLAGGGGEGMPPVPPPLTQPYGPGVGQQPMPGPVAAPHRNLFQRFTDQYTGGPEPNPNSTGMQWLNQLAGQGQVESSQAIQERANRGSMIDILGRALKGDPQALDIATRLPGPYGLKDHPSDDLMHLGMASGSDPATTAKAILYAHLGGPQAMQHFLQMAEKFVPRFGGDLAKAQQYVSEVTGRGYSNLRPSFTPEEENMIQGTIEKLSAKSPMAPLNLLRTYANAQFAGDKVLADAAMKIISTMPTEGQVKSYEFNTNNNFHRDQLKQEAWIHSENHDIAVKNAIREAGGEEARNYFALIDREEKKGAPERSEDTIQAAEQGIAGMLTKLGSIPVTIRDTQGKQQTVTLGTGGMTADRVRRWLRHDTFNMYQRGGGSATAPGGQFTGYNPGGPRTSLDEMIKQTKQGFQDWWDRENFLGSQGTAAGALGTPQGATEND